MNITTSDVTSWNHCHRACYFSNRNHGLGYTPAGDSESIMLGNWGHYTLGLVLRGFPYEEAVLRTFIRQQNLWEQFHSMPDLEDVWARQDKFKNLMKAHELWQKNDTSRYADKKLQVIYTEHKFEVDTPLGVTIEGRWDALVKHKDTGEHFIFERKLTKYPDKLETAVQWDLQPRLYTWAARKLLGEDIRVTGMLYEFIRNCDPYAVKLLKNGSPSKAQTELDGTTYEVYLNALNTWAEHEGIDPAVMWEKYEPQIEYLKRNPKPIFRRTVLTVPESHQKQAVQSAVMAAGEMNIEMQYPEYINPTGLSRYHCDSPFTPCAFKDACLAMDDGADWRGMLDTDFVTNKPHFDEGINEEVLK